MSKIKINYDEAKELLNKLGFELSLNEYDTFRKSKYILAREITKSNRLFILNTEDILKCPVSIIENSKLVIKKDSLDYVFIKAGRTALDFVRKNDLIEALYIDRVDQGFGCSSETQGVSFGTTCGATTEVSDNSRGSCGSISGIKNNYGTGYSVGYSWGNPQMRLASYVINDIVYLQNNYFARLNYITKIWIYDEITKDYVLIYETKNSNS